MLTGVWVVSSHLLIEAGWYYGSFVREQGIPLRMEIVKRRDYLHELSISGFSWSRILPVPGTESSGVVTKEQFHVMGDKTANRFFTEVQLHSMYFPFNWRVTFCEVCVGGAREVIMPSCITRQSRAESLGRFFCAAFHFWFRGVCSDSVDFGPVRRFFLEHISCQYRSAEEPVVDLWDSPDQVPGSAPARVWRADPSTDGVGVCTFWLT